MANNPNHEHASVLKELRSLKPQRPLGFTYALQRAEAQATRLLASHRLTDGRVPSEIITDLPRIGVERDWDIQPLAPPSGTGPAGSSSPSNAAEYSLRQRFSLFHEFKHILDHPVRHLLPQWDLAERIADHFATCVLMPKT